MRTVQELMESGIILEEITDENIRLTLGDSLVRLAEGEELLVTGLDKLGKQLIVRLNRSIIPEVTEVSYDIREPRGKFKDSRYWLPEDISINALAQSKIYRTKGKLDYLHRPNYEVGDVVAYRSSDGEVDTAIVTRVWRERNLAGAIGHAIIGETFVVGGFEDNRGGFWYSLTRDTERYEESELLPVDKAKELW